MTEWRVQIAMWGYAVTGGETLEPDALRVEERDDQYPREVWDETREWLNTWIDQDGHTAPEWWALSHDRSYRRRRFLRGEAA